MKKLFVVIHIITEEGISVEKRTLNQVTLAFDNGANGVFLIPAEGGFPVESTLKCYNSVRSVYPNKFIGINFMASAAVVSKNIPMDASALWTDFGIGCQNHEKEIKTIKNSIHDIDWKGMYYGGFFFKGNNSTFPENVTVMEKCINNAVNYIDVLTTSGSSTGISISLQRLKNIRECHKGIIAVASGVTAENINEILNYADEFIVGTGVEKKSDDNYLIEFYKSAGLPDAVQVGHLDPDKIRTLSAIISQY